MEKIMDNTVITLEEIIKCIPHRYPFLFVDKVVDLKKGESAVGIKNVTINEPFFVGHFPNKPVMPGVLIIEALAQTAGILVSKSINLDRTPLVYFTSIEEAKFKQIVAPGDQLELHVSIIKNKLNLWKIDGKAIVNGKVVCESKFSAMIV